MEHCFVICGNDAIKCVVLGTEDDARKMRDRQKELYAKAHRHMSPEQLDCVYWHWHKVDLFRSGEGL